MEGPAATPRLTAEAEFKAAVGTSYDLDELFFCILQGGAVSQSFLYHCLDMWPKCLYIENCTIKSIGKVMF